MNSEDRYAIDGLFERIEQVARNSPPRDREAEMLIRQRLTEAPASPYYMAQTIIVQERALEGAQERIEQLEAELAQAQRGSGGGFLGGVFGDANRPSGPQNNRQGPWGRRDSGDYQERRSPGMGGGGGFLAGAAQTALGITGGVLLGSAIAGMFSGDAHAGELNADEPGGDNGSEQDAEQDFGGGDDSDFDIGGEF
ncbi:DUF2076 domain-containing protein [Devosia sp. 1566]|uniref:DUF2076 domain-containing protein n=1 Tax=Devosia sp. 1566 TaxID=2499144 RepID=UPI000FD946BB|nr:DUF2076 domain-containing protein [Devosia sp. 1566]